jgi:hypothetical protein
MSCPADAEPGGKLFGAVAGVLAGVLVFMLIVLGLLFFGTVPDEEADPPLAGTPMSPPSPAPAEPVETETAPARTPTPTTEEPAPEPTDREPTDADAAAFTSTFEPPGGAGVESVTVDVTGDGLPEVVVASVAREAVRLDVATWSGMAFDVTFTDVGGPAGEIERFVVRDLGGDGTRQIAVLAVLDEFETVSIWAWDGHEIARAEAAGGCWDSSHVYGIVGVGLRDGEIAATCDDSPLPVAEWSTDVYVWDDGAWRYDRTESP